MKIISLHIQSFGKFENVQLNLQNGVNVLQNENGFGKTTVASFVRAMLYGFTYKAKQQADGTRQTDAGAFQPWNSEKMFGGSMVVQHDGVLYRIERFFGSKLAKEQLSVVNQSTSATVKMDVSPGEYFFGLTADSYDRSVYLPQEAVTMSSTENFDKQLAGLVENGAEDYSKVQENLREYKKFFRYEKGRGGEIPRLEDEIYKLQRQLREIEDNQVIKEQKQRQAQQIQQRLQQVQTEKSRLQQQYEQLSASLPNVATDATQTETRQRVINLKAEIASVPTEIDGDVALAENLAKQLQKQPHVTAKNNVWWPFALAGVLFAIAIALFVVSTPLTTTLAVVLSILGGLSAVVGAILLNKRKQAKQQFASEQADLQQQLQALAQKYRVSTEDWQQVAQLLRNVVQRRESDLRIVAELEKTLAPQPNVALHREISNKMQSVRSQIVTLENEYTQRLVEKTRLEESISLLKVDGVQCAEQISQLQQECGECQRKWDVADKVSQLLQQAKSNLSTSYLPTLCNTCSSFLSAVSGKDLRVVADKKFNISLIENGVTHLIDCFSRGTREMTMFCFRLALSQMLFDGNVPLLIVDDAFVNFDEDNFLRATQLLKQLSARTQVVYFTCQNRLGALA